MVSVCSDRIAFPFQTWQTRSPIEERPPKKQEATWDSQLLCGNCRATLGHTLPCVNLLVPQSIAMVRLRVGRSVDRKASDLGTAFFFAGGGSRSCWADLTICGCPCALASREAYTRCAS